MYSVAAFDEHVAALPSTRVQMLELTSGGSSAVEPPAFLIGEVAVPLRDYFDDRLTLPPVRLYRFQGMSVGPDGLLVDGTVTLSTWWTNHPAGHAAELTGRLVRRQPIVRDVPGQAVLMSGPGYGVYGHWLTDILPRLHVLQLCGIDVHRVRYLVPHQAPDFTIRLLAAFGIREEQLLRYDEEAELVRMDELLVPTNLREQDRFSPLMRDARLALMALFEPQRPAGRPATGRRLFIRRPDSVRTLENKEVIERIAQEHGFEMVRPERLSIPEQIALFSEAEELVGEYGSGLHNCLFSKPGTCVLALRGSSRYPGLIQSGLCEVLGQKVGYVLAPSAFAAIAQSFSIPELAFRQGLHCLGQARRATLEGRPTVAIHPSGCVRTNDGGVVTSLGERTQTVPPTVIPLPPGQVVHRLVSPGFSLDAPDVLHAELIAPDMRAALARMWGRDQPERLVEFHSLRDVFVVGEGLVFDRHLNLLQPSITQSDAGAVLSAFELLKACLAEGRVKAFEGPLLLCGKAGLNNYGHWLAEMLPRAYMSREWIVREGGWRVLVPQVYAWMAGVIEDSLDLLEMGPERRVLNMGQPILVSELVLITGLTEHGEYFSPLVVEAMDAMAASVPAGEDSKVWITREGETRSLTDESAANIRIAGAGWRVVHPGRISLREQISMAKGAKHMAGVNGAGLANLVFMRPGGSLTSFVPAVMPDVFYWQLSGHRGLSYREIRSSQQHELGGPTIWDAPLRISHEDVLTELHRSCGE